tara:strand:- start:2676 stop:4205 length:1530 start_codon:yes stop_codon:yes gene_type:complete
MATVTITPKDVKAKTNSRRVAFSKTYTTTLSTETIRGGFYDEQTVNTLSGKISANTESVIATLKIEADSNKRFLKTPTITAVNRNDVNKVRILTTSTEKTSGYITTYTFDVIYSNSVSVVDPLKYKINYKEVTIPGTSLSIDRLKVKQSNISQYGETRDITVIGQPNTPFEITVNRITESRQTVSDQTNPKTGKALVVTTNSTEESILSSTNRNATKKDGLGGTINCISRTLDKTGRFTFKQKFDRLPEIISTKVNGSMAVSGATKVIFDSLTGVEVGDKIESASIKPYQTIIVTELNPDDDNVNECTLSGSITMADNTDVKFRRASSYAINITSDNTLSSRIPTTSPTYTLYQRINPILTLTASESDTSRYTITDQNGVTTSAGVVSTASYAGEVDKRIDKPSTTDRIPSKFNISYLLTGSGGTSFSTHDESPQTLKPIKFSRTNSKNTRWSNSSPKDNGGTELSITNISKTASGGETITITATVKVHKWGLEDTTMNLNLSEIVLNT